MWKNRCCDLFCIHQHRYVGALDVVQQTIKGEYTNGIINLRKKQGIDVPFTTIFIEALITFFCNAVLNPINPEEIFSGSWEGSSISRSKLSPHLILASRATAFTFFRVSKVLTQQHGLIFSYGFDLATMTDTALLVALAYLCGGIRKSCLT
jgi:hypothetical protein